MYVCMYVCVCVRLSSSCDADVIDFVGERGLCMYVCVCVCVCASVCLC